MELIELFSSKEVIKSFSLWVNNYPLSYHPLDMKRFEEFVVTLFVNNESLDYKNLEYFLKQNHNFSDSDFGYFSSRIRNGLSLLESYKSEENK